MRAVKAVLSAAMLGGVLLAASGASGASMPAGGAIHVWVIPSETGNGGGKVLVAGAIGDYGTAERVNASGKPSAKGTYRKVLLKKGTILLDLAKFSALNNSVNPAVNPSNCSGYFTVSAPVPIVSGTGAYAGISGTLDLSSETAFILPKTKTGKCNMDANPLDLQGTVNGSGAVKFK